MKERRRGEGTWSDGVPVDLLSGSDPAKYIGAEQRPTTKSRIFEQVRWWGIGKK